MLTCAGCGAELEAARAHVERVEDPDDDAAPELEFFCPACAVREFGRLPRSPS